MQCHGNPMKKEFQIEKSAKLCEMQKWCSSKNWEEKSGVFVSLDIPRGFIDTVEELDVKMGRLGIYAINFFTSWFSFFLITHLGVYLIQMAPWWMVTILQFTTTTCNTIFWWNPRSYWWSLPLSDYTFTTYRMMALLTRLTLKSSPPHQIIGEQLYHGTLVILHISA